jgi:hypothetical protein
MVNHKWAENSMKCSIARIHELLPNKMESWAHFRLIRERETMGALLQLKWKVLEEGQ